VDIDLPMNGSSTRTLTSLLPSRAPSSPRQLLVFLFFRTKSSWIFAYVFVKSVAE